MLLIKEDNDLDEDHFQVESEAKPQPVKNKAPLSGVDKHSLFSSFPRCLLFPQNSPLCCLGGESSASTSKSRPLSSFCACRRATKIYFINGKQVF